MSLVIWLLAYKFLGSFKFLGILWPVHFYIALHRIRISMFTFEQTSVLPPFWISKIAACKCILWTIKQTHRNILAERQNSWTDFDKTWHDWLLTVPESQPYVTTSAGIALCGWSGHIRDLSHLQVSFLLFVLLLSLPHAQVSFLDRSWQSTLCFKERGV